MSLLTYDIFLIFWSALVCTKDHYAKLFQMLWTILEKLSSLVTADLLCKCHGLLKWVDVHKIHQVKIRTGYCEEDYYYFSKQKVS